MSERQSDSMRFKRELDEHITKSDDSPAHAPVSEEVNARKLLADLFGLSVENLDTHFGKKDVAEDVATISAALQAAKAAQALETAEHIRTGPHEGCHGACCKALRKEGKRARVEAFDEAAACVLGQTVGGNKAPGSASRVLLACAIRALAAQGASK